MIEKMWHGLKNLLGVGRGVVSDDSGDFQLVQVQFNSNETKDDIPRIPSMDLIHAHLMDTMH
jgi:phage gp45-like